MQSESNIERIQYFFGIFKNVLSFFKNFSIFFLLVSELYFKVAGGSDGAPH